MLARPLMSFGEDERDIDKHAWKLRPPLPLHDPANDLHLEISRLATELTDEIESVQFGSIIRTIRHDLPADLAATRRVTNSTPSSSIC